MSITPSNFVPSTLYPNQVAEKTALVTELSTTQTNLTSHTHNGTNSPKLSQANTHETPDTNTADSSIHHTIGTGSHQAAAGNLAEYTANKGQANGYASLDSSGKVPQLQLPAIVINNVFVVNSEAEMLALSAIKGDTAVRNDIGKTFILSTTHPEILADWIELLYVVTPESIGLGNVDNTADLDKSISTATQSALDDKLDTSDFTTTNIGLGNVDNTSDLDKPVSTATQAALDDKLNSADFTKANIGLGNVDNTSDLDKPISTATQAALDAKQDVLTNPITGTGTSTQLAIFNGTTSLTSSASIVWDSNAPMLTVGGGVTGTNLKIGTGDNYTSIENDGTIVFNGTATEWNDLRVASSSVRLGSSAPTLTGGFAGNANLYLSYFNYQGTTNQVFFEVQLPHSYKIGSTIHPHVHFSPVTNTAGVSKNVRWKLDYSWKDINGTFGTISTYTMDKAFTDSQWKHLIATNGGIAGTGITGISSMLVCRLYRDVDDAADTYDDSVAFLEFDIHFEQDTFGSREEYIK